MERFQLWEIYSHSITPLSFTVTSNRDMPPDHTDGKGTYFLSTSQTLGPYAVMSQESTSLLKGSIGTESYCVYPDLASVHLVFMGPPTREDLKLFAYVTSFSPHTNLMY